MSIDKTRCDAIDGRTYSRPGKELAQTLLNWLSDGAAVVAAAPPSTPVTAAVPTGEPSPLDVAVTAGKELIAGTPFNELAAKLKKHIESCPEDVRGKVRELLLADYNEAKKHQEAA